ncbi:necrosis inducing protein, partial [Calycina marina]
GHRYDWEGAIVWLSSSTATTAANIVAICPSAHGDWDCSTSFTLSGTHTLVEYLSLFPLNHSMELPTIVRGMQPLIAYESLPAAALSTLENCDLGNAIVPLVDAAFTNNLAAA